jgi:dolichyl-phosphate-mannose--protein O-mannosyl transferase
MQLSVLERLNGVIQRRFAVGFDEDIGVMPAVVVVLLIAVMNFLISLGEPHHPVWDESYYLTAIARYEHGTTQFASHPPLALMLLSGGDLLLHPNRSIDTKRIGWEKQIPDEKLPKGYSFTGIRFMSGVFAALGGLAFFALMLNLTGSPSRAVFFSSFYLFENAFVAHFRAAQLDAFQVCFEIAAILCLVLALRRGPQRIPWLELGFGAAVGLASMVKLNAIVLAPLGAMLLAWRVWEGWRETPRAKLLLTGLRDGLVMTAGCLVMVAACFTAHVIAGSNPPDVKSPAGEKDAGFISPTYWAYLHHDRGLSPAVVAAASWDYWRFMQSDLKGMPMVDANGSKPITWPLHIGAINYRWDSQDHLTSYVQLAGNVLSWWMALVALLATPVLLFLAWWRPQGDGPAWRRALMAILLLQYLIYMGVHIYLGSMRVMYLYHYFLALVISFVLVPLVLAEAAARWPKVRERQDTILSAMVIAIVASFAFYSPLSFHRPLTTGACQVRNVLQHIVKCQ